MRAELQHCAHAGDKKTYKLPYGVLATVCLDCAKQLGRRFGFDPVMPKLSRISATLDRDAKGTCYQMRFGLTGPFDYLEAHVLRCHQCATDPKHPCTLGTDLIEQCETAEAQA
jgi:hypothetical protein